MACSRTPVDITENWSDVVLHDSSRPVKIAVLQKCPVKVFHSITSSTSSKQKHSFRHSRLLSSRSSHTVLRFPSTWHHVLRPLLALHFIHRLAFSFLGENCSLGWFKTWLCVSLTSGLALWSQDSTFCSFTLVWSPVSVVHYPSVVQQARVNYNLSSSNIYWAN